MVWRVADVVGERTNSRFPPGMTERKARATTKATATAKEEADSLRE
jgi:hypothetical protein